MQRRLLLLACFFSWLCGSAQLYPIVYYTPNDGLINSRVRNIKQDSKGRLYFITYGGLSVYDGSRFTNYGQQEGLANELVNDVVEVAPDSLLVATNTQKLNTLVHGKIGSYNTVDNFFPVVNRFFKSEDGNWYTATDDGLFLMTSNKFERLPFSDSKGNNLGLFLDQIIEWKNFFLIVPWKIIQNRSLILYNKLTHQVTDVFSNEPVISIAKDKLGQVWVSTPEKIELIDLEKLQAGKIDLIPPPEKYKELADIKDAFLFFDSKNNMWVYNNNLVEKISSPSQKEIFATGKTLKAGTLINMFEDREGIIWIASDGNGVVKIKGTGVSFINEIGTSPLQVSAIQTKDDTTWLFNKVDHSFYHIYKNSLHAFPLASEMYMPGSIYFIGNRMLWTEQKKIMSIQNKNDPNSYKDPKTIVGDLPQGLSFGYGVADDHGSIIQLLNENDSAFFLMVIMNNKIVMKQPIDGIADQFAIDKNDRLWVATRGNHLTIFTIHPDQPMKYLQLLKVYSEQLPFAGPRSMAIDNNNNIWIGTRYDGIVKLQFDGSQIHAIAKFNTRNGLTDNFIYTLHVDDSNNVWAGTQTGLDKIFLKNGHYIISNISRNNNFFQTISKVAIGTDLVAWALTNEGTVLKVAPSFVSSSATPSVLIDLLKVNEKPANNPEYRFHYNENNFQFTVAATSYTDERSIRYSYLLKGSGNNVWSDPSTNSNLNFINLPPGNYVLHVKAEFPDGIYEPEENSLSFVITPPWWQAWWFRILIGILTISVLIMVIRFYYQRKLARQRIILEKQQAIEKERTRIATDMHDDLGAGLSRIKFLSETIGIKKQQQQPIEEEISKIREYSHTMIDKMGEIVWALNERNDSLSDLLSYTRSYAVEYLSENGISYKVDMPENLSNQFVSGEFRQNIFLSVKEILHNIVKHAQANSVVITFSATNFLIIEIKDDGIGFDQNEIKPFRNGLININKRMKEMGGKMEIENKKGTMMRLIVPINP